MTNEKDPRRWDEVIIDSPFAKLTKRDVHEYYRTPEVQKKILDAVGNREAIVRQSFAPDKTVLRRKDERGSLIRLDSGALDKWNERRLSEVHPTFGRKTDVLLADIDPQEGVDWRRTKKITETVAKTLQSHPAVRDVSVRYSGGRGFYVEGKLDEPVGVDRARNLTKSILDGLAQRHDVFFEPVGPGHIRLDTTPLKYRGSIRSPYSIHSETGLVSAPVKIEELPSVQKKDFTVQKVLERMREKKSQHTLITGRPGSGKTTYLHELEQQTGLPSIHLDSIPERKAAWEQMMASKKNLEEIENRIVHEALARKEPHLIEGWQLLNVDPKELEPHNRVLVEPGYARSMQQFVNRELKRNPKYDVEDLKHRAGMLAAESKESIKKFRAIPGTKVVQPREKKATASLPQSLLDEVSKDKWATRAYGQKTLREIKEGKREVVPIQDKGKTVGFMSPNKSPLGYPSTGFVFVSPSSRGKGLAAKVLKEYAKKNPKAISFIHRDNIASQKAHEHGGWENTGEVARGNPRAQVWKVKKAMEEKLGFEIPWSTLLAASDDVPIIYYRHKKQQEAHEAAKQMAQQSLNQFHLPAQSVAAAKLGAATEFAPGIPMNRKVHKIPTSTTPQTWTLAIQKHDADRAGTHFDFRLVPPQGGKAHSWAIPKARLPEQGKMLLAIQQPTHTAHYAENFTGTIPKGTYGSGKVDMHLKEPVKILSSGDNKIKFERDNGEKYTLFRTRDKHWGITKNAAQVIEDWKKKKKEEKVTAFIRERMRGN